MHQKNMGETSVHLLTVDFELTGYEGVEGLIKFEKITKDMLDFFKENKIQATFFCVGDVLESCPDLIQEIASQGHEIACHGWRHIPLDKLTKNELQYGFQYFLDKAQELGLGRIFGYRAPFFSLTQETYWASEVIKNFGFEYDSSILPAKTLLYGYAESSTEPHRFPNGLLEVPISVWRPFSQFGLKIGIPLFGGTYLRLLPKVMLGSLYGLRQRDNFPVMSYCHPYDLDVSLKNTQAFEDNFFYNFLLGLGQKTMKSKLKVLCENKKTETIHSWIQDNSEKLI